MPDIAASMALTAMARPSYTQRVVPNSPSSTLPPPAPKFAIFPPFPKPSRRRRDLLAFRHHAAQARRPRETQGKQAVGVVAAEEEANEAGAA